MNVCVLILNTNAWADTIECLESVFRSEGIDNLSVIVCDNDSQDGSLSYIRAWAEGRASSYVAPSNSLRPLSFPPLPKPVSYVEYDRAEAERGGDPMIHAPLTLIRTGGNLGFMGGNNVGLRFLLARGGFDYVWLLNPDTAVRPDALRQLIQTVQNDPQVGICGSTIRYYHAPDTVQVLGGVQYNFWLAKVSPLGTGQSASLPIDAEEVKTRMAYVYGASMLVTRGFLEEVGLLCEDYFLYYDELDWAMRAKGKFRLGYAPASVVFHREGGTIGGSIRTTGKSWLADYHSVRNRILFTRKFVPHALPTVYLTLVAAMLRRAGRGQWDRVGMIARLLWST